MRHRLRTSMHRTCLLSFLMPIFALMSHAHWRLILEFSKFVSIADPRPSHHSRGQKDQRSRGHSEERQAQSQEDSPDRERPCPDR